MLAKDQRGAPLSGRVITATLERPTDKRGDRTVDLGESVAGDYSGSVPDLAPGQWDLVVDVLEGGERAFRRRTRIVLP